MNTELNKIKCFLITRDKTALDVRKLSKKLTDFDLVFLPPNQEEWLTLKSALLSCPKNKYCFIIRDDSISYSKADIISKFILATLKSSWDCFYLCRWLDSCEKYTTYNKGEGNYLTSKCYSPRGLQALIISPAGREKIEKLGIESENQLINFIENEKLTAHGSIPNLFNVDPSKYTDELDVVKNFMCQSVYPPRPIDLSEPAIVSNLQTQLIQTTLPPIIEPTVQEKTFYNKLSLTSPATLIAWLTILIMVIALMDSCIMCYRNYKKKEKEN